MSRQAMEMALDCLLYYNRREAYPRPESPTSKTIEALRAALVEAGADQSELQFLREANEAFAKRQEWWTDRMFELEQERDKLAAALAEPIPWKQAIDDGLVTIESTTDSFETPRKALDALIDWHVSVAIDPRVSSEAQALIDRGRAEAQADAEPVAWMIHDSAALGRTIWLTSDPKDAEESLDAGCRVRPLVFQEFRRESAESAKAELSDEELLGAIARGWFVPENKGKELNTDVAMAIANEVRAVLRAAGGEG